MADGARAAGEGPVERVRDAVQGPAWPVTWMARAGYAARGVIYFIMGGVAVLAAAGAVRSVTGWRGALRHLFALPVGRVLVVAVVVGLAGHAIWALIQAGFDPEERARGRRLPEADTPAGRVGYRLSRLFEGLLHVAMVVGGVGLITGFHDAAAVAADDGILPQSHAQRWTAWLMSMPLGIWLVALVGAGVVGFGMFEVVRAWRTQFDAMLSLRPIGRRWRRAVVHVSRFGIAARGVVIGMVGMWLIVAAWDANAREAKGMGATLRYLKERPEGPWLFVVAAVGLVAYGTYEFMRAAYRRIGAGR